MCRIFAMAAAADVPPLIKSKLLREFFNSFAESYSGGWGIGYFTDEGPMVIREPVKATDSFALPGAIRRTEPGFVMAHVRNPTSGDKSVLNTHPFQKDGWIFSHNGTLGDPLSLRAKLLERYSETLQGSTDSEIMFHYILQRIEQAGTAEAGIQAAVREMSRDPDAETSALNFAMTDGTVFFVLRKAFKNYEKYSMHYASLDSIEMVGKGILNDRCSSSAVIASSEPFTAGKWTSLNMGEMLVATAEGHRIIGV
jgi:predicted glutamine amidotransferase